MSDNNNSEGTFKRLVRTLSRSRGSQTKVPTLRTPSRERGDRSTGLSTSPPPTSYFPQPPSSTLKDTEAAGLSRHPDSLGARAADIGATSQGAPGVSFAPARASRVIKTDTELEGWQPPPRRTQSQRVRKTDTSSTGATGGGLSRSRAGSAGAATVLAGAGGAGTRGEKGEEGVLLPSVQFQNGTGGRRGVQLEDKPLSRSTSVKRAVSTVKKAMASSFQPPAKAAGEKRVLIFVADGSEEMEVMTAFDVCVRGGLGPVIVSISPIFSPSQTLPYVTMSRGAKLMADTQFETLSQEIKNDFDAVIVPGGAKGAERLSSDPSVRRLLWEFYEAGKLCGFICAGSIVAKASGVALGARITSHPSVKAEVEKHYEYSEERVVVDGNMVSSRGPGTAIEFSLKIVEILAGKEKRDEVAGPMML